MSEVPRITTNADFIFNPEHHEEDPTLEVFYERIRATVNPLIDQYSPEDIDHMPAQEWSQLRNSLLGVRITLKPNGEVIHE